MPRAKKTWGEKMKAKPPHDVILEKDFAGIPKGSNLHISCPVEVAAELKTIALALPCRFRHSGANWRRKTIAMPHAPSPHPFF
jgi:hypothetical protein